MEDLVNGGRRLLPPPKERFDGFDIFEEEEEEGEGEDEEEEDARRGEDGDRIE